MTDIVERLRLTDPKDKTASGILQEAADEIERQRALVNQMHAQYRQWELDAFDKIERLRGKLATINGLTSPGNRTLDEMMRDMGMACDMARTALAEAKDG